MKFFLFFISIIFLSCTNNSSILNSEEYIDSESIASRTIGSENVRNAHIEEFYLIALAKDSNAYNIDSSNSQLFVDHSLTRSSSQTLYAYGFDKKVILNKYKLTFGFPCSGLTQGVPYYAELQQYMKYVEIPKGYSIAIPAANPPLLLKSVGERNMLYGLNMGYVPGSSNFQTGYSVKYISTSGNKDKYAFITDVEVISKNLKTNKNLNPIVYNPECITNPGNFEYAYQIVNIPW